MVIQVDDYSTTHSAKNELKFIDGLGTWAPELKNVRRSALLAGYLTGCFKRTEWGKIDPITIMRYASEALLMSVPVTDIAEHG